MATKKTPAQAEVEGFEKIHFTVTIRNKEIELETVADLMDAPVEVSEAFEQNKPLAAFRALLGELQYSKLKAVGVTTREFLEIILPAWQEATGLGEG